MKSALRKFSVIAAALLVFALAGIALRGPSATPILNEKRREIQDLQERNATMAAENERKRLRIEKLKHSRAEQELVIRERLKLLRPGETQFILPDQPKSE